MGMNEWYGMAFVVPFALLLMAAAAACLAWLQSAGKNPEPAIILTLTAGCLVAAVAWLAAPAPEPHNFLSPRGGSQFLFSRPPPTRGVSVARFDLRPEVGRRHGAGVAGRRVEDVRVARG